MPTQTIQFVAPIDLEPYVDAFGLAQLQPRVRLRVHANGKTSELPLVLPPEAIQPAAAGQVALWLLTCEADGEVLTPIPESVASEPPVFTAVEVAAAHPAAGAEEAVESVRVVESLAAVAVVFVDRRQELLSDWPTSFEGIDVAAFFAEPTDGSGPVKLLSPVGGPTLHKSRDEAWEYKPGTPFPRHDLGGPADPAIPRIDATWFSQYVALAQAPLNVKSTRTFLPEELKTLAVRMMLALSPTRGRFEREVDEVQAAYAARTPNATVRLRRAGGRPSADDQYFVDRLLNGMQPSLFERGGSEDEVKLTFDWDAYDLRGTYELPNVEAVFRRTEATLEPIHIDVAFRPLGLGSADALRAAAEPRRPRRYTPDSHPRRWTWAKRLVLGCYLLTGEIDSHLSRGHLLAEQYLMALMRSVPRSARLSSLLYPHLRQSDRINHFGEPLIFGEHGVLASTSALGGRAITQRFLEQLGGVDWRGWRPRAPICAGDRYARAADLYWRLLGEYVDDAFGSNDVEFMAPASVLTRFSSELVTHAVPYRRRQGLERARWWDGNEVASETWTNAEGQTEPRREGEHPSVHPLRGSNPDWLKEDLRQLCRYAIFHATFYHSWTHNRQYDDGGDLDFATLGLRRNDEPPLEDDDYARWRDAAMPSTAAGAYQLYVARMLVQLEHGYICRPPSRMWRWFDGRQDHEDYRAFAHLRTLLEANADQFAQLGLRIEDIRSRVNT